MQRRYLDRVTAEYVADVPYVRHYVADLAPARLRLVAALHGVVPPPATDFDYCELGCGHGDTLAALAAAHPEARFLGVDLGASHVASAKRLARDGALENVGFLARDFADLVDEDLGELDYVTAHGVLSWVSPEKRRALVAFARAKLRPGGLLFVSYNAMPGWAAIEPLRQLLLFPSVGRENEDALVRAKRGLELATAMQRAGAAYFEQNPAATDMLRTMTQAGLPYVVHEYMHEHWAPMYFANVAWEMAQGDLHYVGSLPVCTNFPETGVPEAIETLLASAPDRVTFESLKDLALNQFFRRDVFVKGPVPRSDAAKNDYLDTTPWGMLTGAPPTARTVTLSHRTVDLTGPIFEALYGALARGAAPLPELVARDTRLTGRSSEELRAALVRLLVVEHVVPWQSAGRAPEVHADDALYLPSAYNQMMIRRAASDLPLVLTSSVAGDAYPISALDALALRAMTEARGAAQEGWVRDFVGRSVLRLRVGERVVEDPAEQIQAILAVIAQIRSERLPKLLELGVLARSD